MSLLKFQLVCPSLNQNLWIYEYKCFLKGETLLQSVWGLGYNCDQYILLLYSTQLIPELFLDFHTGFITMDSGHSRSQCDVSRHSDTLRQHRNLQNRNILQISSNRKVYKLQTARARKCFKIYKINILE